MSSDDEVETAQARRRRVYHKERKNKLKGNYNPRNEPRIPAKPKQTGKPKAPPSAYTLWMSANRGDFKAENPDAKVTELMRLMAGKWSEVKEDEKAVGKFKKQAAKAKADYVDVRAAYVKSSKYRKWKAAVKEWNEVHREEYQEQVGVGGISD